MVSVMVCPLLSDTREVRDSFPETLTHTRSVSKVLTWTHVRKRCGKEDRKGNAGEVRGPERRGRKRVGHKDNVVSGEVQDKRKTVESDTFRLYV